VSAAPAPSSPPPPPPGADPALAALRARVLEQDRALVAALAERARLVEAVAARKRQVGVPAFDRAREAEVLGAALEEARRAGVPGDLVRGVMGHVLAASRRAQRFAVPPAEDPPRSIGVVGGTAGMGAFLAEVFAREGIPVETMGKDRGAPAEEVAARHDLVIVAVPIADTLEVIARVGPRVAPGACLADVTSLKRAPLEAMLLAAPPSVDVVGTHPMFGPRGADLDRQKVVLCRGRGERGFARVRRLFEGAGAETVEAGAAEHDAHMAVIQVLVHEKTMVVGSVLERLGADLARSLAFASPVYRAELAMVGRMFSQRAELYADILTGNPEGARISHAFREEAGRIAAAVAAGDRGALVRRFDEVAGYMTRFASWARQQSDAILDDIVKHG
jgi:chorismate mutase/prephenate dehydrogenase